MWRRAARERGKARCGRGPQGPSSDLLRSPGRAVRQEATSKRNSGQADRSAGRGRGRSVLKVFLKTVSKVTQRPGSYLSPPPLPLGRCTDQNDSVPELGPGHASGPSGQRQSDASAGEKSSPSPAAAGLRPHAGAAALARGYSTAWCPAASTRCRRWVLAVPQPDCHPPTPTSDPLQSQSHMSVSEFCAPPPGRQVLAGRKTAGLRLNLCSRSVIPR